MLSLVVAAAALVVDVTAGRDDDEPSTSGGGTGGAATSPSPAPPSSQAAPPSAATTQPAVGECLSDARSLAVVTCTSSHLLEVFATGDCSDEALVRYLGGQPGRENLLVGPQELPVEGGRLCVVADASGGPSVTAAGGVLQTGAASAWRRCHDARTSADVPCSVPHTAELLPPAGSTDCGRAAADYLGTAVRNVQDRLQVLTVQQDAGPQCVIATRGRDLLHSSVRGLGSSALPLVQD